MHLIFARHITSLSFFFYLIFWRTLPILITDEKFRLFGFNLDMRMHNYATFDARNTCHVAENVCTSIFFYLAMRGMIYDGFFRSASTVNTMCGID